MIAITCDRCGKDYKLRDELAGRQARCVCGATIAVPVPRVAAAPLMPPSSPSACIVPPAPTKPPLRSTRSDVAREPRRRSPRLALFLIPTGILLAAGLVVGWHFTVGRDHWEAGHRAQLLGMRDEARSLANQGKLADAAARYGDLLSMAAGHPLQDPEVSRSVVDAKSECRDVTTRIASNGQRERDRLATAEQARARQEAQVADTARARQQTEDANVRALLERWATTQENAAAVEARMRSLRSLARSYSEAGDPEASLKAANDLNDADPRLSELNGQVDALGQQIGLLDPILVLVTVRAMAVDPHQTNARRPIYAQLAATLSQNVAEADVEQWRANRETTLSK